MTNTPAQISASNADIIRWIKEVQGSPGAPFTKCNPNMENIYNHCKVWDEIAYPFLNFNGAAVEIWEWISYFISHFTLVVINFLVRIKWIARSFVVFCFAPVTLPVRN